MSKFYEAIAHNAERFPDHEAIVEGEIRWSYGDFKRQVDQAAAGFNALGIEKGDRVGLMLFNQKEFLASFFALRKIGAVIVPINIQMLPQDIGFVILNSGVRHIVIADILVSHLSHLPLNLIVVGEPDGTRQTFEQLLAASPEDTSVVPTDENELGFLLYTSGTTGHPKGVMLTERNVLANIEGFEKVLDFTEKDRLVMALPLFHSFGLIVALTGLTVGGTLALVPKFQPKSILETLVREKATILPLVPTLYTVILELVKRQGDLTFPNLRYCISGGASLPGQLLKQIEDVLKAPVIEGYGMTETSPVLTVNDPETGSIPGCVGKPLFNVEVKIVREDGSQCITGEVGEVLVRGENVMSGYYNLPEETLAVLTDDGWLKTGDLGHLDAEGRLYISGGRKKDLIIRAGENISPLSIEEVLYRHEGVREAAVVGIPHPKLGEDIGACISLKEGASVTSQEILRHCREHLSGSYIPGSVEFFDELPKNPTGKIVKKLLRESLAQRATSQS